MGSDLVQEALPEGQNLSCRTEHPGFKPVVLDIWSSEWPFPDLTLKRKKLTNRQDQKKGNDDFPTSCESMFGQ